MISLVTPAHSVQPGEHEDEECAPQRDQSAARREHGDGARNEAEGRAGHGEREVADVAGADQDAVEHEHGAAERLHQRHREQDRAQLAADGSVAREDEARGRGRGGDQQPEDERRPPRPTAASAATSPG